MFKKNSITITLYALLHVFHLQPRSDETNAALGAGIFLFTATAMATRARIKSHEIGLEIIEQEVQLKQISRNQQIGKQVVQDMQQAWYKNQKKLPLEQNFLHQLTQVTTRKVTLQELAHIENLQSIDSLKIFFNKHVLQMPSNEAEHIFLDNSTTQGTIKASTERTFAPKNSNTKKVIYIPVIHGTFAKKGKSFGDDENHTISEAMICYAERLALEKNAVVKLFVIKWDGAYNENNRISAGKNLADAMTKTIQKEDPSAQISLQVVAHSYGCDVARTMINNMHANNQNVHFDSAYFLASPPTNIHISAAIKDYHIYGDLDGVATAEAYRLSNRQSTSIHNPNAHMNIKIISSDEQNDEHNHKTIKYSGIRYLPALLEAAKNHPHANAITAVICKKNPQTMIDEDEYNLSDSANTSTFSIATNIDLNPHQMRSFADAAKSEARSIGLDIDGFLCKMGLKFIAGIENMLSNTTSSASINSQSSSSDSSKNSPTRSTSSSTSPISNIDDAQEYNLNESGYKTTKNS